MGSVGLTHSTAATKKQPLRLTPLLSRSSRQNQCRALGKRKHTCCPVKPLVFRLRFRPHSCSSRAVSQVLELPSECPLGTQGHQELHKEIQRITESPRKCFLSITIRPCCQGIFEATSRKNEQETWIYTKPFSAAPTGGWRTSRHRCIFPPVDVLMLT